MPEQITVRFTMVLRVTDREAFLAYRERNDLELHEDDARNLIDFLDAADLEAKVLAIPGLALVEQTTIGAVCYDPEPL